MQILGDQNAILKDLTIIAEEEIASREREIYREVSTDLRAADQAYVKVPIQTKVPFPKVFDGELDDESTEVAVIQEYNMATYGLSLVFGSDLMTESKAYSLASKTQEGTQSAVQFPGYHFTSMVTQDSSTGTANFASGPKAFDGIQFYVPANATTGAHFWPGGDKATTKRIVNSIAQTGTTVTDLWTDLQAAVKLLGTYLDNQGRLLNPGMIFGRGKLLIRAPLALQGQFMQLLHSSILPVTVPVTTSGTTAATGTGVATLSQFDGLADLYCDGYLDALNAGGNGNRWYLDFIAKPQKPFAFGESYPLRGRALGIGTEYETRKHKCAINLWHRFVQGVYRFDRSVRVG